MKGLLNLELDSRSVGCRPCIDDDIVKCVTGCSLLKTNSFHWELHADGRVGTFNKHGEDDCGKPILKDCSGATSCYRRDDICAHRSLLLLASSCTVWLSVRLP